MTHYCFVCRRDFAGPGYCAQCDLPLIGGNAVEIRDALHRAIVLLHRRYEADVRETLPGRIIRPEPLPSVNTGPIISALREVVAEIVTACKGSLVRLMILFRERSNIGRPSCS